MFLTDTLACSSLSSCWSDYLQARKSPLWAEQFFRCGELTTYWECAEERQTDCLANVKDYTQISKKLYQKVREECDGNATALLE